MKIRVSLEPFDYRKIVYIDASPETTLEEVIAKSGLSTNGIAYDCCDYELACDELISLKTQLAKNHGIAVYKFGAETISLKFWKIIDDNSESFNNKPRVVYKCASARNML